MSIALLLDCSRCFFVRLNYSLLRRRYRGQSSGLDAGALTQVSAVTGRPPVDKIQLEAGGVVCYPMAMMVKCAAVFVHTDVYFPEPYTLIEHLAGMTIGQQKQLTFSVRLFLGSVNGPLA